MSNTQANLAYVINGQVMATTPGGSQVGGMLEINLGAGPDVTDEVAGAFFNALLAVFPAAWGVTNASIVIQKQGTSETNYATDYSGAQPTFS